MKCWLPIAVLALAGLSGCRFDGISFYDVTRTPTEECDILPQGEFCVTPDQLSPPTFELWSVDRQGDELRVLIDDEMWIANPARKNDDPNLVKSDKLEVASREPGPCTTTTTRSIEILATDQDLTGTIKEKTRLEGPEDCGDTPRGLRSVARLDGVLTGAP